MNTSLIKILVTVALLATCGRPVQAQILVPVDSGGTIVDFMTNVFNFTVTDDFLLADVSLRISLSHDYISDLEAVLRSPSGTELFLFTAIGALSPEVEGQKRGYFEDVLFTDSAPDRLPSDAPTRVSGEYQVQLFPGGGPGGFAEAFGGQMSAGTWQLLVRDTAQRDEGYLYKQGDDTDMVPDAMPRFGPAEGTQLTLVPVPEPAAYAGVFGLAALGFGVFWRCRNSRAAG
jgi:hypothetical protein